MPTPEEVASTILTYAKNAAYHTTQASLTTDPEEIAIHIEATDRNLRMVELAVRQTRATLDLE